MSAPHANTHWRACGTIHFPSSHGDWPPAPFADTNPMRITFVLPFAGLSGGVRIVASYAEHLRRRGHEVLVVSTPPNRPGFMDSLRQFKRGRGWPKTPASMPSHLDRADV